MKHAETILLVFLAENCKACVVGRGLAPTANPTSNRSTDPWCCGYLLIKLEYSGDSPQTMRYELRRLNSTINWNLLNWFIAVIFVVAPNQAICASYGYCTRYHGITGIDSSTRTKYIDCTYKSKNCEDDTQDEQKLFRTRTLLCQNQIG